MSDVDKKIDPVHPAHGLQRWRSRRPFRLICGLHLAEDFSRVDGALMASRSGGKWLRPQVYRSFSLAVPDILRGMILDLVAADAVELRQLPSILQDLAGVQSEVIETLLTGSVNNFENVLAVCVGGASLWVRDFDGRPICYSLCDPDRICEKTGLSVIDSLHHRDIAIGGLGGPLSPLPYWLLFGDRDSRVATRSRLLVNLGRNLELTYLPPSDGLDSEVPPIQYSICPGNSICSFVPSSGINEDQFGKIAVQGKLNEPLLGAWQTICQNEKWNWQPNSSNGFESLVEFRESFDKQESNIKVHDALCTMHHVFISQIDAAIQKTAITSDDERIKPVNEIILVGATSQLGLLQRLIEEKFPDQKIRQIDEFDYTRESLPVAVAATLGFMHIDQLPATLPEFTGAEFPRILGRLTPGRPSSWRQLLTEMADYRPPTMKLREAV